MNKALINAISDIDSAYVMEAENFKVERRSNRSKIAIVSSLSAAACVSVAAGVCAICLLPKNRAGGGNQKPMIVYDVGKISCRFNEVNAVGDVEVSIDVSIRKNGMKLFLDKYASTRDGEKFEIVLAQIKSYTNFSLLTGGELVKDQFVVHSIDSYEALEEYDGCETDEYYTYTVNAKVPDELITGEVGAIGCILKTTATLADGRALVCNTIGHYNPTFSNFVYCVKGDTVKLSSKSELEVYGDRTTLQTSPVDPEYDWYKKWIYVVTVIDKKFIFSEVDASDVEFFTEASIKPEYDRIVNGSWSGLFECAGLNYYNDYNFDAQRFY